MTHLLFIFGRLKPHGDELYSTYLRGTIPIMQRYGVKVLAVGSGLNAPDLSEDQERWPVNAILGFRDYNAYLAFFEDADYQHIKTLYRDQAYEVLNLYLMQVEPHRYDADELSALLSAREVLGVSLHSGLDAPSYQNVTSLLLSGQGRGEDTPHVTQELIRRYPHVSLFPADHAPPHTQEARRLYYFINRPPRALS